MPCDLVIMHHRGAAGQSNAANAGMALGVRNASKLKASRIALDPCPLKPSWSPCMVTVEHMEDRSCQGEYRDCLCWPPALPHVRRETKKEREKKWGGGQQQPITQLAVDDLLLCPCQKFCKPLIAADLSLKQSATSRIEAISKPSKRSLTHP